MNTTMTTTTWSVEITLGETDGRTQAIARLRTDDKTHLVGTGFARLSPGDRNVPEIGEELAAARSLHDLADRLLGAALGDVSENSNESLTMGDLR